MRLTAMIAAAAIMPGSAAAAHADTYIWADGQDSGTFTTGAASPLGSGNFLLTDFFFATADAGDRVFTNENITTFYNDASFNPTLDSFGNDFLGGFFPDTSGFGIKTLT